MLQKNRVILFADDDAEDQELLEEAILKLDSLVQMHKVVNGKYAIDYLESCPDNELPVLIILDFKMPILNAAEVLAFLKKNSRYEKIPKIVWSSSKQPQYAEACLEGGAKQYFVKPFNLIELRTMASEIVTLLKTNS